MTFISHAFLCAFTMALAFGTSRSSSHNFSTGSARISLLTSAETNNATNQSSEVPLPNVELRRVKLLRISQRQHHARFAAQNRNKSASDYFGDYSNLNDKENPIILHRVCNGSAAIELLSGKGCADSFPEFHDPRPIAKRKRSEYSRTRTRDELKLTMTDISVIMVMTVVFAAWGIGIIPGQNIERVSDIFVFVSFSALAFLCLSEFL